MYCQLKTCKIFTKRVRDVTMYKEGGVLVKPRNEILMEILKKSGKSQEAFAESLGIKKAAFNNYIKGRREIPNTLMETLAEVYSINPAVFFYEDVPMYISELKTSSNITNKIVSIVEQLNESRQNEVYIYAENKLKEQKNEENNKIDAELNELLDEYAEKYGIDSLDALFDEIMEQRRKVDNDQAQA